MGMPNHFLIVTFNSEYCNALIVLFLSQSASHGGQHVTTFQAYAMSHKGKATSDVQYNPEDPPSAYSNPSAYSRLSSYSEVAKEVHGADYDPATHDLDGEIVMRAGGGKKHGRYYLGDNTIDSTTTPTLSQIRAQSTSSSPAIRPRPTTTHLAMQAIQVSSVLFVVRSFSILRCSHSRLTFEEIL